MKRRDFLTGTTLATVGIATLFIEGCNNTKNNNEEQTLDNEIKLEFELDEETISSLQEKLTSGKYSSEKLVELYLKRIETIDKEGPTLNSIIEINPDAISIAREMDKERRDGKLRGDLHGIPVLIKDNIDTADKMQTTAGSLSMVGNIASNDAFVVKRL